MNLTGNLQKPDLVKMSHAIHQSRGRKDKLINPCIGVSLRYVEAADYLSKCPKFGEVYENGGVSLPRRRELDSILMNLGNGTDRKLGGLIEMVQGRSVTKTKSRSTRNFGDDSESVGRADGTVNGSQDDYLEEKLVADGFV